MRRIIGGVFQSLDGVMQAPGGPEEDPTGGFALGGWSTSFWDEAMGGKMGAFFGSPFELLLGRKTYEIFAAHWPYAPADDPIGPLFNRIAKHVVTGSTEPLTWSNSHALPDIAAIAALKAGEGPDLLIQGSTTLYPALLAQGLIDRLFLMTFPVVLGSGKRLFGAGTPPSALWLVEHDVSSTGVILATYAPAGPIPIGSFQHAEPSEAEIARRERMRRER